MPFTRSPTLSSRDVDRMRTRPRRTADTSISSPPRRNNTTRKINVVSKASLAMLNPAYAMGMDDGPSWFEEQQQQRLAMGDSTVSSPTISPSGSLATVDSSWTMDYTPELEAFATEEIQSEDEETALGLVLGAPAMQRKVSQESVFEDDEPAAPATRRTGYQTMNPSSSSSLSRFFTWKKPARGKPSGPLSSPWEVQVPLSAPSQIQSFALPKLEGLPSHESNSMPPTPADAFIATPLPSPAKKAPMSRKSSMPTLRDIRRATGSPLTVEIPFPHVTTAAAASSFYWRTDSPVTPTLCSPSTSCSSNLSGKSLATRSSSSRISSMGRGAARKSSVETPVNPIIMVKPPKKRPQQQQRSDPWKLQNLPPVPSHPSLSSLIPEDKQENAPRSSSLRRRSRSVDAFVPLGYEAMKRNESQVTPAVRVKVVGFNQSTIVGSVSPKLLAKKKPIVINVQSPQRDYNLLQVVESPVVVNVMPPTPDLGSTERSTFDGASASPSVRRSRSETEIAHLIESNQDTFISKQYREGEDSDEETFLPYAAGERFDDDELEQIQHGTSLISESPISVQSQATGEGEEDETFGFARSMSMMSLSSEASTDSEMSEEGAASVESAKILSASSTMSSFSRALLVSPRMGEFNSWGSQGALSGSSSVETSMTSLASPSFSSPPCSSNSTNNTKRSSKRLSGLPSLSSSQSLASLMTTSSSILDYGAEYIFPNDVKSNLSSPVELQGQMEGEDCLTPRLSDGFHCTNTTKPLVVRKVNQDQYNPPPPSSQSDYQTGALSPISPRPFPRAHNATSPHLELDLSLPLDLHGIGLGFPEIPKRREKPRVPSKSRARPARSSSSAAAVVEPKTPPTNIRRLSNLIKEERKIDSFGLGLGLGFDSAFTQTIECQDNVTQWRKHQRKSSSSVSSSFGLAL